ncbi:MAG: clan AA aspartic protease [Proteobacteria bacterium]|nr:clan AA aspartic protease [Burkholderiales bacterium]
MGVTYAALRLSHFGRDDIESLDADALVDTGANNIVPQSVVDQLHLAPIGQRNVQLADGRRASFPCVGPLLVESMGRRCITDALVMGDQVLLGTIALQAMDMVVHPASHRLLPNPESPDIQSSRA